MEEEVANLPKHGCQEHSSSNGPLKRYQDKLIGKYMDEIGAFEQSVRKMSSDCSEALAKRMNRYFKETEEVKENQNNILCSVGSTSVTFEEMRDELKSLGDSLVTLTENTHQDILAIYSAAFNKLKPVVDAAFQSCELYITQLPEQFSNRLPDEVKRLNRNFLTTKQELIKKLYSMLLDIKQHNENVDNEFMKRKDNWKESRFTKLVEDSKKQLDPFDPIDFGNLFEEFKEDQSKFTYCARKVLSNLVLIVPPDHFRKEDLDAWWQEAEEVLTSHGTFIANFLSKFQMKVDERNQANATLVASLENEFSEFKSESEASQVLSDIMPLQKASLKVHSMILEKLEKYWNSRRESLHKAFEGIRSFLEPLIESYQKFVTGMDENKEFVQNEIDEIKSTSNRSLEELEATLEQKSNEILLLMTEKDIKARVNDCKEILEKIEKEYRESYDKIISIYDTQPSLVCNLFESCESDAVALLKLKKINNTGELESRPTTGNSTDGKGKKKVVARNTRRSVKLKPSDLPSNVSGITFTLDTGAKFKEEESLIVIPTFDDFVDTETAPTTPTKGDKSKGRTTQRGSKRATKPPGKAKGKGKAGDEDELEIPDFSLLDIVPRIEGVVSIWVYVPMNTDIQEWISNFRRMFMNDIHNRFTAEVRRVEYEAERDELSHELNERMRIHAPRASAIELNVAESRVRQIESRQLQIEKHFVKAVGNFNKGFGNIENGMENRKQLILRECSKLRSFINDLGVQKNTSGFAVLNQNLKIADKQFLSFLEKKRAEQEKEIETFLANFKTLNDRFLQTVVKGDESFSDEEKDVSNQYFDKMNAQIEAIMKNLRSKQDAYNKEIETAHQAILDEYESSVASHRGDAQFNEGLNQLKKEAESKWNALIHRNKQQEIEIDRLLAEDLHTGKVPPSEAQNAIQQIFEKLDKIRVAIIKRGHFLGLLQSNLKPEPLKFEINLTGDASLDKKLVDGESQLERSKSRSKSKVAIKPPAERSKSKAGATPEPANQTAPTFNGIIGGLETDYNTSTSKLSTEYYNSLKSRKLQITRPEQIPPQQSDCIEQMSTAWRKITGNRGQVMEESSLRYRTQVQNAANSAREIQKEIYAIFSLFYTDIVNKERGEIQLRFEADMAEMNKRKNTHNSKMGPKLADQNYTAEFLQLLDDESERSQQELGMITKFSNDTIECEYEQMKLYTSHLPGITATALELFDQFILLEDLSNGQTTSIKRKTMKELMKEKERQATAANDPNGRPFHSREWPSLPIVMKPLVDRPRAPETPTTATSRNRKKAASVKRDEPPHDPQMLPVQHSLDTALSRGLIVERNTLYQDYEAALEKRLEEFNVYIQSLRDENEAFTNHWMQCIASLRPALCAQMTSTD